MSEEQKLRELWMDMIRKSFAPSDWFHGHDGDFEVPQGGSLMWVYKMTEPGVWTVGFFDPYGEWNPEGDYGTREEAAGRCHWLNGGRVAAAPSTESLARR